MNELYHYGIKGQRWGIRRYQNEDGTLTAEGKKRYERDPSVGGMENRTRQRYMDEMFYQYNKNSKKFKKVTDRMEARKNAGLKQRLLDEHRAKKYGTRVRYYDKLAKNLDKWVERDAKAKTKADKVWYAGAGVQAANLARIAIKNGGNLDNIDPSDTASTWAVGIASMIGQSLAYNMSQVESGDYEGYKKWANDLLEDSKKETIEDLKKHGLM